MYHIQVCKNWKPDYFVQFFCFSSCHSSWWPSLCFTFIFNWKRWLKRLLYIMSHSEFKYKDTQGKRTDVHLWRCVPFAPSALFIFWTRISEGKNVYKVYITNRNAWESILKGWSPSLTRLMLPQLISQKYGWRTQLLRPLCCDKTVLWLSRHDWMSSCDSHC